MGGSGKTELPILMYILFANPFHSFHNKSNFEPFNIKKKRLLHWHVCVLIHSLHCEMVYAEINAASNVNEPKNEDEEEKNV